MAAAVSTVGAINRAPLSLNGSGAGAASVPATTFLGKKVVTSRFAQNNKKSNGSFKVVAVKEDKQTDGDRWRDLPTTSLMINKTSPEAKVQLGQHDGWALHCPAFMDKLVVHITKNFLTLPNIKVPLILGVWGGKGQGKSFQCELVMAKMGINPIMMSAGELESEERGRASQAYPSKECTTKEDAACPHHRHRSDFSTLTLLSSVMGVWRSSTGRPREDRIGVCKGIFRTDNIKMKTLSRLLTSSWPIDRFLWCIEAECPPVLRTTEMTLEKLMEYGNMLVMEQDNVKRVQLADQYLNEAALGGIALALLAVELSWSNLRSN
ncbi:hypothetical protein Bca52824_044902 [Brassica carinata]|uniref:Uncharacterized protein n=1 Tax=Brassica carinata TaxID=52824 RepID=A0A8X7RCG4_BRACI|nr:hypothetical protein Bca52824_044902 [Brassica carinata]